MRCPSTQYVIGARSRSHRSAFTLIELAIVVLIMAILAALAIPRFTEALKQQRLESATARISADLRLAQRVARSTGRDQTVAFDLDLDGYYIFPDVRDWKSRPDAYQVELSQPPYGAQIVSAEFNGRSAVIFDGFGQPNTGGRVVVQISDTQQEILLDGDTAAVTVP